MKIHYSYGNQAIKNSTNTLCGIKVNEKYATRNRNDVTCKNCLTRFLDWRI